MLTPSGGLNFSQTQLLNKPLLSRRHDARTRRLQTYAVLTGGFSTLISFATFLAIALK